MKFRAGFVSNSSSSSYICQVCGDTFEAYDQGISDFGLVQCERDHLFCESHAINPKRDGTFDVRCDEEAGENRIESIHCPICQLEHITDFMALTYAARRLGVDIKTMKRDISEDFEDYEQFDDYVCGVDSTFDIELTAHVSGVKAGNKELAHRAARDIVIKNPHMLDVTHCE